MKVTLHWVPDCSPVALKVTVYAMGVKVAVIVPGALTVTVVEALVVDAMARPGVDEAQELKR